MLTTISHAVVCVAVVCYAQQKPSTQSSLTYICLPCNALSDPVTCHSGNATTICLSKVDSPRLQQPGDRNTLGMPGCVHLSVCVCVGGGDVH